MSYIHFHAEANSIEDLKRQLREALGEEDVFQLHFPPMTQAALDAISDTPSASSDEQPSQPDEQDTSEHEQPKAEPAKTYDLVAVRAAANAYKDKHGIEKLREIFKKHGGEKLKDIPEKNYAALMGDIA